MQFYLGLILSDPVIDQAFHRIDWNQNRFNRLCGAPGASGGGHGMSLRAILVVEDEPLILLDMESALTEAGFDVVGVENAANALEHFDAQPAKFAGLITDIRLGEGKTGWELARHIRQAIPVMPIIYISGDSSSDWHAQGVPASVMIQKPFVLAQIITALATLLNQPPHDQGNVDSMPS